jgi:thiamine biosynthesis lipoprotein ApbE
VVDAIERRSRRIGADDVETTATGRRRCRHEKKQMELELGSLAC